MRYKKEITESARSGAIEAFLYYENKQTGLGDRFLDKMEILINRIAEEPEHFQEKHKTFRQAIIKPFSYILIYEIEKSSVVIYKVIYGGKNPKKFYKKK